MKTFTMTITLIFFAWASLPGQGFIRTFDAGRADQFTDIVEFPDGSVVVAGGSDNRTLLLRYDQDGDSLWARYFPLDTALHSFPEALIRTTDNGLAFTGLRWAPEDFAYEIYLAKIDESGALSWETGIPFDDPDEPDSLEVNRGRQLLEMPDGGFLVAGQDGGLSPRLVLLRTDAQGNVLWQQPYPQADHLPEVLGLFSGENGEYIVAGRALMAGQADRGLFLMRIDAQGAILDYDLHTSGIFDILDVTAAPDGSFYFCGTGTGGGLILQLNADGDVLWTLSGDSAAAQTGAFHTIAPTPDDHLLLSVPGTDFPTFKLVKVTLQGALAWETTIQIPAPGLLPGSALPRQTIPSSSGGFFTAGYWQQYPVIPQNINGFVARHNEAGQVYSSVLAGRLFRDSDDDCVFTGIDTVLTNWLVVAEGEQDFYGMSNDDGYYQIAVDTGSYQLRLQPVSSYWTNCDTLDVEVDQAGVVLTNDLGARSLTDCPLLTIDLSAVRLRRCSTAVYQIEYCNLGTRPAEDAQVRVTLDPALSYLGSSLPAADQNGQLLTFDVGEVDIFECGSFSIDVAVDCEAEFGQIHCSEAHIFPDTICIDNFWNGPVLEVSGECQGDSVVFIIENTGADMPEERHYIVTEDNIILMEENFQLGAGEVHTVIIPMVEGSTYWLTAEQSAGFPPLLGNVAAGAVVEGCNGFSPGFALLFPEDDGEPFRSIDCRENVDSFDPNDKQGFPRGYDDQRFIAPGTALEYLIRFQNTGTAPALRVMIRDTLSPWLDPTSVQPGAASHPYRFSTAGDGTLEFTFDPIELPDSSVSQAASQGFIKFRVRQRPGVPLGAVIRNSAAIYFDHNLPILTNETWHTIEEDFVLPGISSSPDQSPFVRLRVSPNPFRETTLFELVAAPTGAKGWLRLFNSAGQPVFSGAFQGNRLRLESHRLSKGWYSYQVFLDGILVSSGKVVVQ